MLAFVRTIWSISLPFGIFCGNLVNFMVIWYMFSRFGALYQEKSGNPVGDDVAVELFTEEISAAENYVLTAISFKKFSF
jgi:hypothetical protein